MENEIAARQTLAEARRRMRAQASLAAKPPAGTRAN
jgi:hypothetical protein